MSRKKSKRQITLFGKTFRLWQLGLVIIILFFISLFAYNLYLDAQDRKKFDEIEYTVDTLVERIDEEFGIESVEDVSRCYESNKKFTSGAHICSYSINFLLSGSPSDESLTNFLKIQDIVTNPDVVFANFDFQTDSKGFDCRLSFTTVDSDTNLSCSAHSKNNHYTFID